MKPIDRSSAPPRSPAPHFDEHRYRAERPGGRGPVTKLQLQRWLVFLLLFLLVLGLITTQAAEPAPITAVTEHASPAPEAATHAELRSRIEKILAQTKTPGAAVVLVRRTGPEWIAGIGYADVALQRPVMPDTLFRIGSTSKAFVALALLKLQEEGELSLHDTLASRAPGLSFSNPWEQSDPVRLVHLLEHTAGWDDLSLREYAYDPPTEATLRVVLDLRPSGRTSRWRPGTRSAYSNIGPAAAAYVIEQVTGRCFEDYIAEHWFRPLQMTTANYFGTPEVQARLTRLYHTDGVTAYPYWKISTRPSGAINASPRELANYVQFHLERGAFGGVQLLAPESVAQMELGTTTLAARDGLTSGYGLYNYATVHDHVWRGHGGGVKGGLTDFAYLPEAGVGYVVMVNSLNGRALAEIGRLVRRHLTEGLTAPVMPPAVQVPAVLARDYRGWYEYDSSRMELMHFFSRLFLVGKVKIDERGLRFWHPIIGHNASWIAISPRTFRSQHEPVATLALITDRSEGTFIQTTHVGGHTWRRVPTWQVGVQFGTLALTGALMLATLLFALVWLPRKLLGRMRDAGPLDVRTWPLLGTCSVLALIAIVFLSRNSMDAIDTFGRVTPSSIGVFVCTLAMPLCGGLGVIQALRQRTECRNRVAWWHALATSVVLGILSLYLAWHGIIGLRTWA